MSQNLRFSLVIPPQDYLSYYQGLARQVSVCAEDGRRIQFPASHLRPFVTQDGIRGRFEMRLDGENRLISLQRIGP